MRGIRTLIHIHRHDRQGIEGESVMVYGTRKEDLRIRPARPEEAEALTGLIMRSKADWGYSQELLNLWREDLAISAETIERDPVYCAEVNGTLAGMAHLKPVSTTDMLLDDLFVEPAFMGAGVGRALWRHAVAMAREHGAHAMVLEADPNAQPFYEHMGATVVGWKDSPSVPGRRLPLMRYDLTEVNASR